MKRFKDLIGLNLTDLINTYKPTKEIGICGIYMIYNVITLKAYIGSARNIYNRWKNHKKLLKLGKHHSIYLQNAWNKYGENSFCFFVLEEVEEKDLIIREQNYLDEFKTYDPEYGFNICPKAENKLGMKHSLEFKEKCRKRMLGNTYSKRKQSEKHVAKRVSKNKGKKRTIETRGRMSEAYYKSRQAGGD